MGSKQQFFIIKKLGVENDNYLHKRIKKISQTLIKYLT